VLRILTFQGRILGTKNSKNYMREAKPLGFGENWRTLQFCSFQISRRTRIGRDWYPFLTTPMADKDTLFFVLLLFVSPMTEKERP
jgi:hypothetical protein